MRPSFPTKASMGVLTHLPALDTHRRLSDTDRTTRRGQ